MKEISAIDKVLNSFKNLPEEELVKLKCPNIIFHLQFMLPGCKEHHESALKQLEDPTLSEDTKKYLQSVVDTTVQRAQETINAINILKTVLK